MAEKEKTSKIETPKTASKSTPKKTNKAKQAVDKLTENTVAIESKQLRDMSEMVSVVSLTNTPLTYVSKSQQGYRVDWSEFLEENYMEYKELINMRNSQRPFFQQPWVVCKWDVLEDLKVDSYYKNMIDIEGLDELFNRDVESLTETLKTVPEGIQKLIVDRAFELRRNGELDSIRVIKAIEDTYKIDLTI